MILSKSIFNLFVTQAKNQKIGFVKLEQEQEANQVRQINPYYGKRVILNINLKTDQYFVKHKSKKYPLKPISDEDIINNLQKIFLMKKTLFLSFNKKNQ